MRQSVIRVESRRAPAIRWACPSCHDTVPFDCSERFRANSNGKLVDIWLVYRCRRCEATKNITIVERRPVDRVPGPLLLAAEHNDARIARAYARDVGLLRRNGTTIADGDDWVVSPVADLGAHAVTLELPEPLLVRLDHVVAASLALSRSALRAAIDRGSVRIDSRHRIDVVRLWAGPVRVVRSA